MNEAGGYTKDYTEGHFMNGTRDRQTERNFKPRGISNISTCVCTFVEIVKTHKHIHTYIYV